MKILILSQVFWPDTASVAQHLADFAQFLSSEKGAIVDVITSAHQYETPKVRYSLREKFNEISIERIRNTGFGKINKLSRLIDFTSFNILLLLKLLRIHKKKYDYILCLTSPPLVSLFGVVIAKFKKSKFCYWVMDMQPELSISVGYLRQGSIVAKLLSNMGDFVIKRSDVVISLDKYMTQHIVNRIGGTDKIGTIPVWPVVEKPYECTRGVNPFILRYNLGGKFIVMYSGNHSVVHPLDTLLNAVRMLHDYNELIFVFVGDGIRKKEVTLFKVKYNLDNIMQLPYQPRSEIHLSLGAADLQVVIMGNNQVGFTHPNKIYGTMLLGKPNIYIGPQGSHISDILNQLPGNIQVSHGEYEKLAERILEFAKLPSEERKKIGNKNREFILKNYASQVLMNQIYKRMIS